MPKPAKPGLPHPLHSVFLLFLKSPIFSLTHFLLQVLLSVPQPGKQWSAQSATVALALPPLRKGLTHLTVVLEAAFSEAPQSSL